MHTCALGLTSNAFANHEISAHLFVGITLELLLRDWDRLPDLEEDLERPELPEDCDQLLDFPFLCHLPSPLPFVS